MDFRIEEPFASELDRMAVVIAEGEGWMAGMGGLSGMGWVTFMGDFI